MSILNKILNYIIDEKSELSESGKDSNMEIMKKSSVEELVSAYHKVKEVAPDYDEPNYTLAEKVFREFNHFDLKNIEEINFMYLDCIPKSLLPYPKNYIKCAYYIFLENAKKQNNLEMFNLIQSVGTHLFLGGYPDYDNYKKNLKTKKGLDGIYKEQSSYINPYIKMRESFKKLYGVYEISEEDYNSSPSSVDSTNEKLIYDFGVLPEIEEDVDFDKIIKK